MSMNESFIATPVGVDPVGVVDRFVTPNLPVVAAMINMNVFISSYEHFVQLTTTPVYNWLLSISFSGLLGFPLNPNQTMAINVGPFWIRTKNYFVHAHKTLED